MRRFIQQCNLKCIGKTPIKIQRVQIANFHQFAKNNRLSKALVSTTFRYKNSSTNPALSDLLENEIGEEKENEEVDIELDDIKKGILKTFKITEEKGLGIVKLTRTYNDELIEVNFDCQNSREEASGINEMESSADDIDQDNEEEFGNDSGSYGIRVEVIINKKNSKLIFHCVAGQSLEIDRVRYVESEFISKDTNELYAGPSFSDLNEK